MTDIKPQVTSKILDVLRVPLAFRVEFIAYLLTDEADHSLWEYIKGDYEVPALTWEDFETLF